MQLCSSTLKLILLEEQESGPGDVQGFFNFIFSMTLEFYINKYSDIKEFEDEHVAEISKVLSVLENLHLESSKSLS